MDNSKTSIPRGYKHEGDAAVIVEELIQVSDVPITIPEEELKKIEKHSVNANRLHQKNKNRVDDINKSNSNTPVQCEAPPADDYVEDAAIASYESE